MIGSVTLILTGSDVASLLDVDKLLRTLRSGFLAQARAPARGLRVRADLPGEGTATALLPGLLAGIPAYTVKVNAKFPEAVPALRGVVCLARSTGALAPPGLRDVHPATFGDVLAGRAPGRGGLGELTVYAPVGLPWQDLAAAWTAYQAATAQGRGLTVDLLAL